MQPPSRSSSLPRSLLALTLISTLTSTVTSTGCTSLNPQLHPTDIAALERLEDREEREQAYEDNQIVVIEDFRGARYTKGRRLGARPRGWQSLDLILRSDRNSSAALPEGKVRAARVLTGFLAASALGLLAGFSASAREGLDLTRPTGTSAILIGSGLASLAFGISAGVKWNQARKGYEEAVDVYNDSLALRLGISDAEGNYRPPPGVLIDEEGYIILDQKEVLVPGNRPSPTAAPKVSPPAAQPEPEAGALPSGAEESEPAADPSAPPEPLGGETPSLEAAPPPGLPPELEGEGEPAPEPESEGARDVEASGGLVGPARASTLR